MLERLIAGADLEFFLNQDWGARFRLFRNADVGIHWDWDSALAFIEDGGLCYPDIKLLDQDGEVHPREYVPTGTDVFSSLVSPPHVKRLLFGGKTVRIAKIQRFREDARLVIRGLRKRIPGAVNINAYMSCGETVGLRAHYDPQHTFAVQCDGEKRWHFGEVVCDNPTPDFRPAIPDGERQVQVLDARPGDVIYFPPGMWHYTSTTSRSLHVTISVCLPTWVEFLYDVIDQVSKVDSVLRGAQPMQLSQGLFCPTPRTEEELALLLDRVRATYPILSKNERKRVPDYGQQNST